MTNRNVLKKLHFHEEFKLKKKSGQIFTSSAENLSH